MSSRIRRSLTLALVTAVLLAPTSVADSRRELRSDDGRADASFAFDEGGADYVRKSFDIPTAWKPFILGAELHLYLGSEDCVEPEPYHVRIDLGHRSMYVDPCSWSGPEPRWGSVVVPTEWLRGGRTVFMLTSTHDGADVRVGVDLSSGDARSEIREYNEADGTWTDLPGEAMVRLVLRLSDEAPESHACSDLPWILEALICVKVPPAVEELVDGIVEDIPLVDELLDEPIPLIP